MPNFKTILPLTQFLTRLVAFRGHKYTAGTFHLALGILFSLMLAACTQTTETKKEMVSLSTDYGAIVIAVNIDNAPKTSAFFIKQVKKGTYAGTTIYRAGTQNDIGKPPKFLEGGPLSKYINDSAITSLKQTSIAKLHKLESTNETGLAHIRGAVSMARDVTGDGKVVPDLVFVLTAMPEFDYGGAGSTDNKGYPVFGKVVKGLGVLDQIAQMERGGDTHIPLLQGQVLTEPVAITGTSVFKSDIRETTKH